MSTPAPDVEQIQLIPDEPPTCVDGEMPLDLLPPDEELSGPAPDKSLVDSVRRFGVLTPVWIISGSEDGTVPNRVAAGRRRVKSARAAGFTNIVTRAFPFGTPLGDVLAIIENTQRSDNPASDVAAIRDLLKKGASEADICAATGLPKVTMQKRRKLLALRPRLLSALDEGEIGTSVAEACAKLSHGKQDALIEILDEHGKLTHSDVKEVLRAQAVAATNSLPDAMFASGEDEDNARSTPVAALHWSEEVTALVERALGLLPPDPGEPGPIHALTFALHNAQRILSTRSNDFKAEAKEERKAPPPFGLADFSNDENINEEVISNAYCGDKIAEKGAVSTPFFYEDLPYISTGGDCRRLVPQEIFVREKRGEPMTYQEIANARLFTYHGMKVKWRKNNFVLSGKFTAENQS